MQAYRPDRVVRVLTTLASGAHFGLWAGAVPVLIAAPALRLFAGDDPDGVWSLRVPATVLDSEATVLTRWGPARLLVEDVRGDLRMPIGMLPWWIFAVLWAHAAVAGALILAFLHQLRRIFQRARDGSPFQESGVTRCLLLHGAVSPGAFGNALVAARPCKYGTCTRGLRPTPTN
jgi:hypothetical protein